MLTAIDQLFMGQNHFSLDGNEKESMDKINSIRKNGGNFQTIKKQVGNENLKKLLEKFYPAHTITEIERILRVPDSTLGRWFAELKMPFVRHRISSRSFPGNTNTEEIAEDNGTLYKKHTVKITPELAYIVGFALGDGSIQKYMLEVFNKDESLREILLKYLRPYGTITEDRRGNGLWRLRLSNGIIAGLVKRNKKIRNDTLEYVLSNDELAKQFIAAFWDAEGSVLRQKNYFHVYLYNSNKDLLDKIGNYLNSKKINYTIIGIKQKERNYYLNGKPVISRKKIYRLGIPKSSFINWANEIGINLQHSKKSKMMKTILDLGGV